MGPETSTVNASTVSPSFWSTPHDGSITYRTASNSRNLTVFVVPAILAACIVIIVSVFIQRYRQKRASANLHNTVNLELDNNIPLALPSEKVVVSHDAYLTSQPKDDAREGQHLYQARLPRAIPNSYHAPRSLAVSQYIDPKRLSSDAAFNRLDPNRRSNSLGSMPPNLKMNMMSSQDSGFASQMSLQATPGSPVSSVYATESSASPLTHHSGFRLKQLIKDAVQRYYAIPNRVRGVCYSSRVFAIGEFDSFGGQLILEGCDQVSLYIPPGALTSPQVVYFMMQFENNDSNDSSLNYSPTFECGPDGLQFEVPVELTFPHSAVDTEVAALSREGNSAWSETNIGGPEISEATPDTVTLKIHHFTGFKLSASKDALRPGINRACRSRIPVRDQSTVSSRRRSVSQRGKRLLVSIFKSGEKVRIYFINYAGSTNFDRMIEEEEKSLQFAKESPWKDFTFWEGKGDLVIECATIAGRSKKVHRIFSFNEKKVLTANREYVEYISPEKDLVLDITFYQKYDKQNSTQFSTKLEKPPPYSVPPISDEPRQQITFQHLTNLMSNLQPYYATQNYSLQDGSQKTALLEVPNRPYSRSISDVTKQCSGRQPQEHCEHNGACNCWRDGRRSPVESECNVFMTQDEGMRRGHTNRRSKESGYGSTVQSPVSPLKGPDSLSGNDSMINEAGSGHELTLHSISSQSLNPSANQDYVQRTDI